MKERLRVEYFEGGPVHLSQEEKKAEREKEKARKKSKT